ncbi:AsmA family protein [Acetobacter fallax]|uniref:AsmA family protein n=1 Tax=Acetobacter fallax TaxID=1737473 RepID=A0ABX0KE27_9PROT|nr:AsmA family protein [Acetobacter fallax]NHO34280.1 AsmA family protein [Acetobacter fallax]NHO37829.1 AsmA family protein [Acetobacter fallax]
MNQTSFFHRHRFSVTGTALFLLAIVLLIIFWSWDWFVPLVNRKATAALGRPTSIAHLHVRPGFVTRVTVDDLKSEQPKDFEGEGAPFFTAAHATVAFDVWRYIWHRSVSIPLIALDTPAADIRRRQNGQNNYTFGSSDNKGSSSDSGFSLSSLKELLINDGHVRFRDDKLRADMAIALHTTPPAGAADRGTIVADASGRYAGQPVTGHFIGGALLSLTDAKTPYPVDLNVRNGPTRATLKGSVDDPLAFRGARLRLHFSGPDMSLLYPLTAIPIPQTPAYDITGNLDYSEKLIRFSDFAGKMGSSDIGGTITVDPHQKVPFVEAALQSRRVDIEDLSGFIGGKPGPDTTAQAKADAHDPNILPDTSINVPKLQAINAHVTYRGEHIQNRRLPLDNIDAEFAIQDGAIDLKRLNFAVGKGTLASSATFVPGPHGFSTKAKFDFRQIDLAHVMTSTTGTAAQGGIIGGNFVLNSTGNSIASLVANGNGGLTLVLDQGGDISALLPEVLGLQFGNAILSALGLPAHTRLDCFIADMPLRDGLVNTKTLLLETKETRTLGRGTVNFKSNTIDYSLTTRAIHPTIFSLPGAFNITGALKSPTVLPGAEILGRAAAAAGLGFVFPPLAILPMIQLGVGKGSRCEQAVQAVNDNPAAGIAPGGMAQARSADANGVRKGSARPSTATGHAGKGHGSMKPLNAAEVRAAWEKKLRKSGK